MLYEVITVILLHEKDQEQPDPDDRRKLEITTLGHFGLAVDGKPLAVGKWKRKQSLVRNNFV